MYTAYSSVADGSKSQCATVSPNWDHVTVMWLPNGLIIVASARFSFRARNKLTEDACFRKLMVGFVGASVAPELAGSAA